MQDLDQVCRFLLKAFCLTSLTWAPRWVAMGCARVCVSVEAVAVAEVAEVKDNILESS